MSWHLEVSGIPGISLTYQIFGSTVGPDRCVAIFPAHTEPELAGKLARLCVEEANKAEAEKREN